MTALEYSPMIAPAARNATRSRSMLAAMLVLLAAAALYPFRDFPPYEATIIIGSVGAVAIIGAVLIKYGKRPPLNCEIAVLAGTSMSFVVAPVIARIVSSDFTRWAASPERRAVQDGYGGGILIVLLFLGVFLMMSAILGDREALRFGDGRLASAFSQRTYIVFIVFGLMLWSARSDLLRSGSYYSILRTRFQFDDPRYSVLSQIDTGFGPMILSFVWAAFLTRHLRLGWVLSYTLLDLAWNFISGGRQRTIMVGVAILVTYIVHRRRVPFKTIAVLLIPAMLLIGFMDFYRYAIRRIGDPSSISVGTVVDALTSARDEGERQGVRNTMEVAAARLSDLDSVAAIYLWVPTRVPFLNGQTYEAILPALVPRALWPEKPAVVIGINGWFFQHEGGSSGVTTAGEGYMNFGIMGVILAAVVNALLVRSVDRLVARFLWNTAMLPAYVAILSNIAFMHGQTMAVLITTVIKMIILILMVQVLTRPGQVHLEEYGGHTTLAAGGAR